MQTAYLIAEVVAIPLSGFLSRALGTRIMFAGSAAGFTFASLMCGLTSSMNEMIFWRAVQGFIGGGMVPTVFASTYTIFPRSKQAMIVPMIGLVATLAPTIGPTVGGYLTDALSWHWLFFINIVPGIVVTAATFALIDFDKPDWSLFQHFDWWGLGFMAAFLGALEYVLEEGPRYDWFDDRDHRALWPWSRVLSAVAFFARVLTARAADRRSQGLCQPQLRARQHVLVRARHRALWADLSVIRSISEEIRGYNALMIGETMFVSGVAMFLSAPVVGKLVTKVDPRLMLIVGFCHLRGRHLADDLCDQGLGFLRAAVAADLPRRRHDAGDRADHQSGARHARRPSGSRTPPACST